MNLKSILSIIPVLMVAANVNADDWTIERCIDYALEHNIDIKLRSNDVENGKLQISDARHGFLPQINGFASQSFNFGRGLTSDNTYANRNTSNFQVGAQLSIPIFNGLKTIRTIEQTKLNLTTLTWQLEQARDNITLNVIAQYLQVLYNKEVVEATKEQVALSRHELERRKALSDAGKIAEVEVLEAESQLAQDELTQVNAINDYNLALLELTQLLQLDTADNFNVVNLNDEEPIIPQANQVYNTALNINSGIKAAESGIDAAKAAISLAQTGYIPTLSFNSGISSSYYKLNGMYNIPFNTQFKENFNTYIGFSLQIPIFDALNTRTSVRRAKVQLLATQLQADQTKSDLYKTIQQAYLQATGARDKYMTAQTSNNAAQVAFNSMSEKYVIGRATSTEYEQSKTNLFKAAIQLIQARYEYILRYRILDFYQHVH